MSRLLHFSYDILLEFSSPVGEHAFALRCMPPSFPGQEILDCTLSLDPQVPYTRQRDGFGNLLQIGRIGQFHDHFRYTLRGSARVDIAARQQERAMPVFRFPSAYTQPWPELERVLGQLNLPRDPRQRAWSLARQTGLAARYVNGLPEGEGASHAWCEVWLDGIWTGIDPTRCQWTDDGYIRFGVGRDFGDCPIERGVFLGLADQTQTVFMRVWEQ